jgi:hypothetical protein
MDIGSQLLMGILQKIEAIEQHLHEGQQIIRDSCHNIQRTLDCMQERYLMTYLRDEYNQEVYAWYDFEADCDDWYIWIIVIFGMTTTFIFYLMTLLHIL